MLELILVIGYIIVTTAIGWILSTRAKARNDINSFFVGKKELSAVLVCFIMFGEMIAGSSTVGSAQTAFSLGLSSAWTNWGQSLGVFVFVLTVSKRTASRATTAPTLCPRPLSSASTPAAAVWSSW